MKKTPSNPQRERRRLVQVVAISGLATVMPASAIASLTPTARQSRGPFYPQRIPLDHDSDLVRVEGRDGLAKGEITDLRGRVFDTNGQPVEGALVEIWQCDANGRYIHRGDNRRIPRDPSFQGYGRTTTDSGGGYRFRTIKPVPYPGRAPHVHFAVRAPGRDPFVTQMYVRGAPQNRRDWLLNAVTDDAARERLLVDFRPVETPGESGLAAEFDIVLP
jgi:protocatechuate 3,4-dioxygenase beta subunit